ncbi:hypothetical protein GT724_22060 [Blautia wexlerae]|nr:hypothetical protein [Blautia wexlerae]
MLGTAKPSGVIFFRTKGEDRNSFISIHRHKFAVQKQRVSDGAMEKHTRGGRKQGKGRTESKTNHTALPAKPYSYLPATSGRGGTG